VRCGDLFDGCGVEQVQASVVDVSLHTECHGGDLGFHELRDAVGGVQGDG
jgi:hypothetical protein